MFLEAFGGDFKVEALSRREWDRFIRKRRSGEVAPPGSKGRPVGDRQIAYDLKFLIGVLNWATTAGDGRRRRLLNANPVTGLKVPKEENPTRVRLDDEEYAALLGVASRVDWRFELALVVAHETGRHIGSIRQLRWIDIDLEKSSVRWREETDKMGYERTTPLTLGAVAALRRARAAHPSVGESWVFPAPNDPSTPCRGDLMTKWWNRAVKLAGLPPKERRGWHSLRRKFATGLKDFSMAVLLELGGWKTERTILKCYQVVDDESLKVALESRSRRVS